MSSSNSISRKGKKSVLNLETAKIADGALSSPANVYEIIGHKISVYRTSDYATYQKQLRSMATYDLQEHAHEVGETPVSNREVLLDRLERRFLEEGSKYAAAKAKSTTNTQGVVDAKVSEFLRRGR